MSNNIEKLNFEVAKLIDVYTNESPKDFEKYFENFNANFYYLLDETNKDEYFYRVLQTYSIFSSLIAEKNDFESTIKIVRSRKHFEKILEILYKKSAISHAELARELGISSQNLSDFMRKMPNVGLIYKIDYSGTIYSLTRKGLITINKIIDYNKVAEILDKAKGFESLKQAVADLSKRMEIVECTIDDLVKLIKKYPMKKENSKLLYESIYNNNYSDGLDVKSHLMNYVQ